MRILASAQPFGFGPAAKLVGIAAQLPSLPVTFVGRGIALRYARLNDRNFTAVEETDLTDLEAARRIVGGYDCVLSVMEPNLVYAGVRAGRPVYFFDSLFGFWLADKGVAELAAIGSTIRMGPECAAEAAFRGLTVHESMIVSHFVSTGSYAQSFPGVAERVRSLSSAGHNGIQTTGPMLDLNLIERLRHSARTQPRRLVVNLGGFNNAFLDYAQRGGYVELMLRWLQNVAQRGEFDEIVVCSGAFPAAYDKAVDGVRIRVGVLSNESFLGLLATGPVYLAAPGLTSLHEAVALGIPVMLLPDQHYGHLQNRRRLAGTQLANYGSSFSDVTPGTDVPDDDLAGTLALADVAAELNADPALFDAFDDYMTGRLGAFMAMTQRQIGAFVDELKEKLDGIDSTPISRLLHELEERTRRATAGQPG